MDSWWDFRRAHAKVTRRTFWAQPCIEVAMRYLNKRFTAEVWTLARKLPGLPGSMSATHMWPKSLDVLSRLDLTEDDLVT